VKPLIILVQLLILGWIESSSKHWLSKIETLVRVTVTVILYFVNIFAAITDSK
jgi:hypothetical protein